MNRFYLCLDVGGTVIKAAPVSSGGVLLAPISRFPSGASGSREEILDHLAGICRRILPENGSLAGIRFAFPGPFDYPEGICRMRGLQKYDNICGVNLRQALSLRLGVPGDRILFCNDAAAFALGEMLRGSGVGVHRILCVCIGTGCGSAFGVDGRLAPEGFPGVPPQGYIYPLPFLNGCIDDYLSRRGLMALSRERLGTAEDGMGLARRAAQGDTSARACFLEFGERVRDALMPIADAFHPQVLCLGGITGSGELFLPPLRLACQDRGIRLAVTQGTSLRAMEGLSGDFLN